MKNLARGGMVMVLGVLFPVLLLSCAHSQAQVQKDGGLTAAPPVLSTNQTRQVPQTNFRQAIATFKNQPGNRLEAAKLILPALKPGMDKKQVRELLGPPDPKVSGDRAWWFYSLAPAQFFEIYFDGSGKVEWIVSTVAPEKLAAG